MPAYALFIRERSRDAAELARYAGLGYAFADRLQSAIAYVTRFGDMLAVAIGAPLLLYASWRAITLIRMIHRLRFRKITASLLRERLNANEKIALVDLVSFEESNPSSGIPGLFGWMRNAFVFPATSRSRKTWMSSSTARLVAN
jgi:hypothetical protein